MNQKVHSATNTTPFQLMYGDNKRYDTLKPQLQNDLTVNHHHDQEERVISKQEYIREAQANLEAAAERMKKQYDKSTSEKHLDIGDKVYIKRESVKKGISKKLSTIYDKLSTVIEDNHPIYKVKQLGSGKVRWIHHNRLRKKVTLPSTNNVLTKPIPQSRDSAQPPEVEFDDSLSEIDFPLTFHNSGIQRENDRPYITSGVTTNMEPPNDTDLPEESPLISLEGNEPQTIEEQASNRLLPPPDQPEIGLTNKEEGRNRERRANVFLRFDKFDKNSDRNK